MKLLVAFAGFVAVVQGYTNPVTIVGYRMFDNKTGTSFAVKGIDYYPRPNSGSLNLNNLDLFTDAYYDVWKDDIEYLAATGANTARLYAVDPSKSHDKFMCALRSKGMYALIDLAASCTNCSVTGDPYPNCYSTTLRERGREIILAFSKYDNVLAFSAGNEVNNEVPNDASINAPCQKNLYIPVGLVVSDHDVVKNNRQVNAKYYNCRTSTDKYENAEWYGINAYQYCNHDEKTLEAASGFHQLQIDFLSFGMTIPVMLTEFGCLNESFQNLVITKHSVRGYKNYGLGYYKPVNCDHKGVKCEYVPLPNYQNLTTQYQKVRLTNESLMSVFKSDRTTFPTCPSGFPTFTCPGQQSSGTWVVGSGSTSKSPTGSSGSSSGSSPASTPTTNEARNQLSLFISTVCIALLSVIMLL
ncbi:putative glucanosyltransferase, glycoside hydrolase superfamily [Plasmopara halstedii]